MENSCMFAGHGYERLYGSIWEIPEYRLMAKSIISQVSDLVSKKNVTTFYFGGALGTDQISFVSVNHIRKKLKKNIKLILVLPYYEYSYDNPDWNKREVFRLRKNVELADKVIFTDHEFGYASDSSESVYGENKLEICHKYMLDKSNYMIAV